MQYDYIIYTDGAYASSRLQGGIGIVISEDGETIMKEYSLPFFDGANSARMELMAAAVALKTIKIPSNILIITDYENLRKGALKLQKRNKNLKIWKSIDDGIEFHKHVHFEWTKGHENDPLNIRADELAVNASQLIKL